MKIPLFLILNLDMITGFHNLIPRRNLFNMVALSIIKPPAISNDKLIDNYVTIMNENMNENMNKYINEYLNEYMDVHMNEHMN